MDSLGALGENFESSRTTRSFSFKSWESSIRQQMDWLEKYPEHLNDPDEVISVFLLDNYLSFMFTLCQVWRHHIAHSL